MINRIKIWNVWRKKNLNNKFYKILVLFGIAISPTFEVLAATYDTMKK